MQNLSMLPMTQIIELLENEIATLQAREIFSFTILNPDLFSATYSGKRVTIDNKEYIYRSYKSWFDLAHLVGCRIKTPQSTDSEAFLLLSYEKLNKDVSFHTLETSKEEKYGSNSIFSEIDKNEESAFLYYYRQALKNVTLQKRSKILNLGVNSGDEFKAIEAVAENFHALELTGVDYCASAIATAKKHYKEYENIMFRQEDINELVKSPQEQYDLIISIGTLQSSNLEFNKLLMSIVQNLLKKDGAIILGFPNCRWIDGEMVYGARVKNYPFSEMGLLYKDAIFAKKYLQQKKFRVTLTGKDYIFLTATSIRK